MGKLRFGLFVCALPLFLLSSLSAQQPTPTTHNETLTGLSADELPNGDVVVSFVAGGDLRGHITLTLHPYANGYTGEWAFTVAHADNTDPATGIDPELEVHHDGDGDAEPHKGFLRLIEQGSLQGTVSTATLTRDDEGGLTDLSATLSIDGGVKEFDGAKGSGQATITGLTLVF